jgi:UDP-N-acetylmuramoylalanine--D-glutamate ligase
MGGNIGTAILSLEPPSENRIHVIECSSFQIDLTPSLAPSIGVLLNITPDHLDRHGTMENYAEIKERLVAKAVVPIIGIDDHWCAAICERVSEQRNVLTFSADGPASTYASGSTIVSGGAPYVSLSGISALRGKHNAQNAAAACAVMVALGLGKDAVASALKSFPGLPHRMEEVGRYAGALFVNDSKATNADSTEKALASFDHIFWILGGKAKEGGIGPLEPYFSKIEKAYLIGAATEQFAVALEGKVPFVRASTLDKAVELASEDVASASAAEPVVLLSPACASYDQYPNFEVRGDHFRNLVRALPGIDLPKGA